MENQEKKKKPIIWIVLGLLLLVGLFYGIKTIVHAINYESTDNAQLESNATPVLCRVAGYIDTLKVADYQDVKPGQLLVIIDDREYKIALQQAEADLLSAQAELNNAKSLLQNSGINKNVVEANRDVQQVKLNKAESDFKRDEALFKEASITQRQYEDSKANLETARKQFLAAKEQVALAGSQSNTSQTQIQRAEALIKTREASIANAKLKLSYTKIYSPVYGRIGKVGLQPGQYIQPGQPLFSIVNNEQFWVVANFKETQLRHLKPGQWVDIRIDGYPDRKVQGRISSFSDATGAKFSLLPPDNATGNFVKVTQRVPVRIDIEDQSKLKDILKAGLSVYVDVAVK
jgi:membrane fusion protein (multidrug efflux system)